MSGLIRTSIDLVLISTVLAGIRRSSGFSMLDITTDKINNDTIKYITDKFLLTGEWVMDRSVEGMSRYPEIFNRK